MQTRADRDTHGQGPMDLKKMQPALANFFAAEPRVGVVYLFGSQARGEATAHSDVDIAVRARGHLPPEEHLALLEWLESGLCALLGRNDVQVVILNGADLLLQYYATRDGQVLYEREPGGAILDWCYTFKKYVDTKRLWGEHAEIIRRNIRERRGCWATSRPSNDG